MKKGGSKAIQELFETCNRAAKNGPKNVPGVAKKDGGGARGGRVAGNGNGRNTYVQAPALLFGLCLGNTRVLVRCGEGRQ